MQYDLRQNGMFDDIFLVQREAAHQPWEDVALFDHMRRQEAFRVLRLLSKDESEQP